jgi:phosphomannomutase/phosphoglucomutase
MNYLRASIKYNQELHAIMAEPNNKEVMNVTPERRQIITYMIAAIVSVTLLAILSWQYIVLPYNNSLFEKNISELAKTQTNAITTYQQLVSSQLKNITRTEKNISLIKNNIENGVISQINPAILNIQKIILNTVTHSKTARIYAPREAQQLKDSGGDIRFVELNMINLAERNKTSYPEAARMANAKGWEIHWVIAIPNTRLNNLSSAPDDENKSPKNQEKPIAILHLTTSLDGLYNTLALYDPGLTQTKLIQNIGRQQQLTFILLGEGTNSNIRIIDVPLSYWQIAMSPSSDFQNQKKSIPFLFIIAVFLSLVFALSMAYVFAQRKIKHEASLYQVMRPNPITTIDGPVIGLEEKTDDTFTTPFNLPDQYLDDDTSDSDDSDLIIPKHIFRAYDIRGIAETEISPAIAQLIGKAVASEAINQGEESLLVGLDARTHSPTLYESLVNGILSTGCNVINIGVVPTPLMNFAATAFNETSSGVVVTASHNPKEYNGFKITLKEKTLTSPEIQKLYQSIIDRDFIVADNKGQLVDEAFNEDYIDTVSADIAIDSNLHVVIDAANGASSEIGPALFNELGCKTTSLHCEFDGDFPNHDPDPSIEANLQLLIDAVKNESADIGIALDGDGDRLVVVTSSGRIIWPDQLLMIFARDVVSRNPGCDVIFDIKSTRRLNQVISSYGGRPIMWKTGHSNIKAKMRETNALLAGEFSGHIFFKERWFGFDDGLYAAARLMEIMSLRDQSLDSMLEAMPELFISPEIKIAVAEDYKFTLIDSIIEKGNFESGEKTLIDGLRVDFDKSWGLVRASNTSAAITLRFEADSTDDLNQVQSLFRREINKIDPTLTLDF